MQALTLNSPDPDEILLDFQERTTTNISQIKKIETKKILPNAFCYSSTTKIYKPIFLMNLDGKILNNNICKPSADIYQKDYPPQSNWIHLGDAVMVQHT